jgi:hypothetical protein
VSDHPTTSRDDRVTDDLRATGPALIFIAAPALSRGRTVDPDDRQVRDAAGATRRSTIGPR